jgi:ribosome recycling factor
MAYNFSQLNKKIEDTKEWLQTEYFSIRTGRATPAVLDAVRVDSYGAQAPINQVANVMVEDARTLRITPYDPSQIKEVEKGIMGTNLGLSVSSDDKGVRVFFPELTSENRETLIKLVKEKLEQARVSIRGERDDVWGDIQKKEKDGDISEDEKFGYKEEMQKLIDKGNKDLEDLAEVKEKELHS